MKQRISSMIMIAAVALAATGRAADDGSQPADLSKPVKVFILMGQSNMVGMGKIAGGEKSLENAVKNAKKYPYLVDAAGAWTARQDVRFVRFMQGRGLMVNDWLGIKGGTIGPEFGIGQFVGNEIDAPVMLLKTCIGNRSLGWDYLPPGSERFVEDGKVYVGSRSPRPPRNCRAATRNGASSMIIAVGGVSRSSSFRHS